MTVATSRVVPLRVLKPQIKQINSIGTKPYWQLTTTIKDDASVQQFLEADYKFKNFARTWEFLNGVALQAAGLRHHPTITTTYNKVNIQLTTHDEGNVITYDDLKLAQAIHNNFLSKFSTGVASSEVTTSQEGSKHKKDSLRTSQLIDDLIKKH